jgi:hypothetical protein
MGKYLLWQIILPQEISLVVLPKMCRLLGKCEVWHKRTRDAQKDQLSILSWIKYFFKVELLWNSAHKYVYKVGSREEWTQIFLLPSA